MIRSGYQTDITGGEEGVVPSGLDQAGKLVENGNFRFDLPVER